MQIVNRETALVGVDTLTPHPRNVNQGNIGLIGESIGQNGFYGSLVVQQSTGHILRGNHTWQAARQAGATEIPVTYVDVDDETALRILLVDNRATREGVDDSNALALLLQELAATPAGLSGSGYDGDALDELLADLGQTAPEMAGDPDAVPEVPAEPITQCGDVWVLGAHRLLCGDATDDGVHRRLLCGGSVDLVLTDPPYGVGLAYGIYEDTPDNLRRLIDRAMPLLLRWPTVLLTPGVPHLWLYPQPTWMLAWVHPAASGSGPWGFQSFNPILAYGPDPKLAAGQGRHADALVMVADRQGEAGHPAIKPFAVWSWLMERGTARAGAHVFDPFAGAGTTILAAERLGHHCSALEIEPAYCDVIVQRWQDLTGQTAVREQVANDARVLSRA